MTQVDGLHEGYVVSDRFRLLHVLGRGGMGSVWVARHLSLNIDVAIKFIDGALALRDDLRSRFAQEARTAARIQSPHVVSILDYGFDGDRPFIAMELLQGESLGARLTRERQLPLADVATIVTQASKGLAKAHALGIVHRDLKPDNLLLCRDDDGSLHVKILDFGIARDDGTFAGAPSHRTGTGQILGTPAYMSPEQAVARSQIDFHSDLYSLAVVAFHSIAGRLPFDCESVGSLIVALTTSEPPPPSTLVPGLPAGVDSWFKCAFQKDPNARFGSAKEMADTFAMACRQSSAAYDATVLADPAAAPAPRRSPSGAPERTRLMTGIVAPGAGPTPAQSAPPSRLGATLPDTFVPQYATQGGAPPPAAPRGPAGVVVGLAALVCMVGLAGAALYAVRGSSRGEGDAAALATGNASRAATAASSASIAPPTVPSAPPAPVVVPPVPSAVPPVASAPTVATPPARPSQPRRPSPPVSTGAAVAVPAPHPAAIPAAIPSAIPSAIPAAIPSATAVPKPAAAPTTNDYGL